MISCGFCVRLGKDLSFIPRLRVRNRATCSPPQVNRTLNRISAGDGLIFRACSEMSTSARIKQHAQVSLIKLSRRVWIYYAQPRSIQSWSKLDKERNIGALSPTGRRPVGGALAPVADHRPGVSGWIGSGVCGFTHCPVWGLATGARRAGSPYPAVPALSPQQAKDGAGKKDIPPHARDRVPRSG